MGSPPWIWFYFFVSRPWHQFWSWTTPHLVHLWLCVCVSTATHMAVSPSSAGKLQLSKGISGTLWRVLPAVPLGDNSCSKVVPCCHRVMYVPHTTTLTQCSITDTQHTNQQTCYYMADDESEMPWAISKVGKLLSFKSRLGHCSRVLLQDLKLGAVYSIWAQKLSLLSWSHTM